MALQALIDATVAHLEAEAALQVPWRREVADCRLDITSMCAESSGWARNGGMPQTQQ